MTSLKHVVCATDFSAPARDAAERAALVAAETGASLTLLHVLPSGPLESVRQWLGAEPAEQLQQQAQRELLQWADELTAARGVRVVSRYASGSVPDEVDRVAAALPADLVVLGARGAGVLRRLTLGTTAERLLRRTPRPVLVVRQTARELYRRVLLALDFSPSSRLVIDLARQVAPQARPKLFHAWQVPFEEKLHFAGVAAATITRYRGEAQAAATEKLFALADEAGLDRQSWDPLLVEGAASQRLLEQEQEQAADLVVLGKRGQSATEELLLGSVTRHLIAEGTVDMLVAPSPGAMPGRG
ncbi:MAG TPA: universal stress protein [Thermoanaerobaculia bacterium]|nr:universal stress protein [Thermoanaerobaculia bacterium]